MNGETLETLERYVRGDLPQTQHAELESRLGRDPELAALLLEVHEANELSGLLRTSGPEPAAESPAIDGYDTGRELHRGGQGVVYAATQRSTGRRVAIKVLLAGPDATDRQSRRLEREIELAASINHPGVITVFDRAQTADGRPALVMELVEGRTLDAYLREESPGLTGTLRLIASICDVVSAAHQRGVIHRDLKPANILIDATGSPKVVDFGLAKDSGNEIPRGDTLEGEFMGTLAYAGPEQVERGAVAADVRSDVYALGAMLGEAILGRPPIDVSGPIAGAIGRIREAPPTPPSAGHRGLDRDVDTIVLKAMVKDPRRRYQSAGALATDIRRFLADEPILARPASTVYQLRKFAKRRRALVGSAGVALAALVTLTAVIAVALVRTTAANERAIQSAEAASVDADKQSRMNAFLRDLLSSPEPGRSGPDLTVVELLRDASERIETEFAAYPSLRAPLHATLGRAYWRLGDTDASATNLEAAISLYESLGSDAGPDELPSTISALGLVAQTEGDLDRAAELHERALEIWTRLGLGDSIGRLRTLGNLAATRMTQGETAAAESAYLQVIDALRERPSSNDARLLLAQSLVSLGALLRPQERYEEAIAAYDEALPVLRELRGDEHPDTLACLGNRAATLVDLGMVAEAEPQLRELIEIRRRVFGPSHERVGIALNNLADLLRSEERYTESVVLFEETIAIFSESLGENHPRVGMTLHNMGVAQTRSGDPEAALPNITRAIDILAGVVPGTHWILAQLRLSLAETLLGLDRPADALPLASDAQSALIAQFGPTHWRSVAARGLLTRIESADQDAQQAEPRHHQGDIIPGSSTPAESDPEATLGSSEPSRRDPHPR